MTNMKLTNFGKSILAPEEHAAGSPRYWIGYYALAYVPDRESDPISLTAGGKLTQTGDVIYNIWQGDMVNGYAQNNPEDTAASALFGLTMYDRSIRTNYRYVYDPGKPNDPTRPSRNRLVAWKSISSGNGENTLERKGVNIYDGATAGNPSGMPIPAPLFYGGEPSNGTISTGDVTTDMPVSADYRYYVGTRDTATYGWKASSETQESPVIDDDADGLLTSISNFNKFHGTASSEGYGVSSVSSCHNMSKATKLFPISHYTVVNDNGKKLAETKRTEKATPLAKAIKFTIDLSPITADSGYTALNYEDGGVSDDQDTESRKAYESKYVSFKFNRIGIYAVPMTVHRYSADTATDACNLQKVQFEIDGDEEPRLFAVADINDTIISDNPSETSEDNPDYAGGVAKFSLEFILHVDDDKESDVETRTAVYYDLYENDATTWYKNQLLASASISEAVTDLSIEMNALKQQVGSSGKETCGENLDTGRYALKNHSHDYLKNIVDGVEKAGSVRGIDTCEEGDGNGMISVFGLSLLAPDAAQTSTVLSSISFWESGTTTTIPDSYVYGEGFVASANVPATNCLTYSQLATIVKVMGVTWLIDNVVTSCGWRQDSSSDAGDLDYIYIWVDDSTHYAKISTTTGEISIQTLDGGSSAEYQAIVVVDAVPETMFGGGYSVGTDSVTLGKDTAASGKYSLVQGKLAYSDSDYSTILGSESVKCENSPYLTILGANGFDVVDSDRSIVFGNGMARPGTSGSYPATLKNVHSSILGGDFYDDGSGMMSNGISDSMWLMQQNGDYSYGAEGTITGSLLTGNILLGAAESSTFGGGVSARNALVLRASESPDFRVSGPIVSSIAIGDGYSVWGVGEHDEELDRKITLVNSISIAGNTHDYLNANSIAWSETEGTESDVPSSNCSIQVGGNICKSFTSSLMLSVGGASLSPFSINTQLGRSDESASYGALESILVGASNRYGECVKQSLVLGEISNVPDRSQGLVMVGDSNNLGAWRDDKVSTLADFNQAVAEGTLTRGAYYVILGSGNLKVSNGAGGFVDTPLSGEADDIYAGVHVDSDGIVTYTPYETTTFTNSNNMTRTVSIGKTRYTRLNPRDLSKSLIIGANNTVHSVSTSGLSMVGSSNTASLTNLENVTVLGSNVHLDGITVGVSARAYGEDVNGMPLYPTISNAHFLCSGLTLNLSSVEPYATHSFKDAIVNLTSDYDQSVLGIYPHPMHYYAMPNDADRHVAWGIALGDATVNDAPFHIDPNLFDNYKKAWIHFEPEYGEQIWNEYNTTTGTITPAHGTHTWSQIVEYAESIQSEDDKYRGYTWEGFEDPFTGLTRAQIRAMVGKPDAPMVYTGGIALAGKATGENYGLIKLGHVSKPVAYIKAHGIESWNSGSGLLQPVSVTGTTTCPYAGMNLTIDGQQEPDGTMHLVLSRGTMGAGSNSEFITETITVGSATVDKQLKGGRLYSVSGSAGNTLDLDPSYMSVGEECVLTMPASGPTVKIYNTALSASETYLIRRVARKLAESASPSSAVLVTKCSFII